MMYSNGDTKGLYPKPSSYDKAISEAKIKTIVKNGLGETLAVRLRWQITNGMGNLEKEILILSLFLT